MILVSSGNVLKRSESIEKDPASTGYGCTAECF